MSDWQPIESAPKDGTRVRLRRVFQRHVIAEGEGCFGDVTIHYAADDGGPQTFQGVWVDGDGCHFFPTPTHWLPLARSPQETP